MNDFNGTYYEEQVSESQIAVYLAKVMGWMGLGLLTTFVTILLCLNSHTFLNFLFTNSMAYYAIIIAELAVVMAMSAAVNKISASVATVLFMVYSALTGVTMTVFVLMFSLDSIFTTFLMTAAIFAAMSVYGVVTKRDLTKIGTIAMFGLFGIIIAGVVNLFFYSSMIDFIVCSVGVLIFIVLVAYDTQKIKGMYTSAVSAGADEEGEHLRKAAIYGALALYLDFINIFLMLLRIFGKRRS